MTNGVDRRTVLKAGAAIGLALGGLIAIPEIYSADFLFTVGNEIYNDLPKWRFQHGEPAKLPVIIRSPCGAGAEP